MEIMSNTSATCEPAENATGEKVDQVLTIAFGILGS